MAGRSNNRDPETDRKLPWRPPGFGPAKPRDLPAAQARARYRRKPDGVPSKSMAEASAEARNIASLVRDLETPVATDPTIRPTLMTDAQLIQLVKNLERADRYDWRAHARPDQIQPEEYRTWLYIAGRGAGKALPLTLEVPTPTGWSTMGELRVGDLVFDECGRPCEVTAISPIMVPDRAYRFTFSDGATIDSCDEHQWITWSHSERKAYGRTGKRGVRVANEAFPIDWADRPSRTTREIVETLTYGQRKDTNHCVPTAGALDLATAELPIHPYLLGYWLGDGTSAGGSITIGGDDAVESLARLSAFVEFTDRAQVKAGTSAKAYGTRGLRRRLREMGLINNKHVPGAYLRASAEQRLHLLQGLMDSDGTCNISNGCVEFCSTRYKLAGAVFELAVSLGQKPVVKELCGKDCGPKWRVTWRPTGVNPFLLTRKWDRVRPGLRNMHRMIVSAEPIEPVPMRCITVDSPNSMYLASRWMIPTHNSRASAEAVREWCQVPETRVAVMAKDSKTLRDFCFEGVSGLIAVFPPEEIKAYYKGLGDCRIELVNGGKIMGFSAEAPDSMRGGSFSKAWGDEFAAWPKNLAQDALDQIWFTLRESERPQVILSTTPKRVPHVQHLMDRAETDPTVVVTKGKTSDNTALSAAALEELYARYGGTHLGRQELDGEMLDDVEGALWTPLMLEFARLPDEYQMPKFRKIICAVDPSGSATGDATGIVVVAYTFDKRLFVLGCYSTKGLAAERYNHVCRAAVKHGAHEILYESNFSGDNAALGMENQWKHLTQTGEITTPQPRVKASTLRGNKAIKASPVAALYEQQANVGVERIFHVAQSRTNGLAILESELISWSVKDKASPNSLDALVIGARRAMQECGLEVVAGSAMNRRIRGSSGAY